MNNTTKFAGWSGWWEREVKEVSKESEGVVDGFEDIQTTGGSESLEAGNRLVKVRQLNDRTRLVDT